MVFCTYCGHSFTRDEHLERHILTHTNVKPFKCFTCHMSFARRDLLQRHYTVHGRNQDQQPVPAIDGLMPKSAGRTPIACVNCAKTKTKCDKKFPCTRCSSRNLTCTLRPTRRSTKNAARLGLITAETLAAGLVNGELPPDQTIAAQKVVLPISAISGDESEGAALSAPSMPSTRSGSLSDSSLGPNGSSDGASLREEHSETPPAIESSPVTPHSGTDFSDSTYFPGSLGSGSNFPDGVTEEKSPQYNIDWQQVHSSMEIDPHLQVDGLSNQDLDLDFGAIDLASQIDPMLAMQTDYSHSLLPTLATPITPGTNDGNFGNAYLLDSVIFSPPGRQPSIDSASSMEALDKSMTLASQFNDPVVAARAGWNVFRCVPQVQPKLCPKTARWNLEALEHSLKSPDLWNNWTPSPEVATEQSHDQVTVMQLHESSRDKLLAITQGFLHKAFEIHRASSSASTSANLPTNFLLLPPTRVLEYLLRSYANNFERYFPVTNKATLDANELMHCFNDKASSLLILLMLAHGAKSIPSPEARSLPGGLIETCRISLFDMIERNIVMASNQHTLHAALIFVELGSWSGDKWQMDIAKGQRGIYTAMLRHSGMLGSQPTEEVESSSVVPGDDNQAWNLWVQQETRSRLVHSWAMVDQEVALFHDCIPSFSVTEFSVPIPQADRLWRAEDADEWSELMQDSPDDSPCLKDLFRSFLDDELETPIAPLSLRLLLHPLQMMVSHYSQLMSCFSDSGASRAKNKTVTASSTRCRLEEVQCLLQRWHGLATAYLRTNEMCAIMQSSLVLYHLICLNTVTDFPLIERLARREGFDGTYQTLVWLHRRCISDTGEALFHCGQIFRVVRAMPKAVRPSWWSAAVYRASLVVWCDSLINKDVPNMHHKAGQTVAIDALPHDHPLILRYLNKGDGIPVLTKSNGSTVMLDHGMTVLGHCIDLIEEGMPTLFSEGITSKLQQLMTT